MNDALDRFRRSVLPALATAQTEGKIARGSGAEVQSDGGTLPGMRVSNQAGSFRQVLTVFEADRVTSTGCARFRDIMEPHVVSVTSLLKDRRLAGFSREQAIFLDVEASALRHSAANMAFLVGLGWLDAGNLVVEQVFCDGPEDEPAQLAHVLNRLESKSYLVSYNGKAYDKTVLEARFVIHGLMSRPEAQLRLTPHLDVLHLGRRLLSGLLSNHRLPTLESEVLGVSRLDDIPGAEVPGAYFSFLLHGHTSEIVRVFQHNLLDISNLALLAHALLEILASFWSTGHWGSDDFPTPVRPSARARFTDEQWAIIGLNVARLLLVNRDCAEATRLLSAVFGPLPDARRGEAVRTMDEALRREGKSRSERIKALEMTAEACSGNLEVSAYLDGLNQKKGKRSGKALGKPPGPRSI